ncbi:hypothetical protein NPIL_435571 [Nephila pilipes]|uniref:Uncharacterized protein n=1 Tax=Nephila pilipes TaxID=299642 RepID=A0A8X6PX35_NEPPI|nr:hypothetical protein NPIL_435571 [Nephila pilipes]
MTPNRHSRRPSQVKSCGPVRHGTLSPHVFLYACPWLLYFGHLCVEKGFVFLYGRIITNRLSFPYYKKATTRKKLGLELHGTTLDHCR